MRVAYSFTRIRLLTSLIVRSLRYTAATELINAKCELTTIQKVLGHKSLDTTLRYARVHDETIADEFYAAMERVEQRLSIEPVEEEPGKDAASLCPEDEVIKVQVLSWIERLAGEELSPADRQLVAVSLKMALFKGLPGVGLPAG